MDARDKDKCQWYQPDVSYADLKSRGTQTRLTTRLGRFSGSFAQDDDGISLALYAGDTATTLVQYCNM